MLLPLSQLRIRAYKAFAGAVALDLRPLTIVFGYNGAGKSAVCTLPAAISAGLRGEGPPGLPLVVGPHRLGASHLDLRHGRTLQDFEVGISQPLAAIDGQVHLDCELSADTALSLHTPGQLMREWRLSGPDGALALRGRAGRPVEASAGPVPSGFNGLVPRWEGHHDAQPALPEPFACVALGAARGLGGADFTPQRAEQRLEVGATGEDTRAAIDAAWWTGRRSVWEELQSAVAAVLDVELSLEELVQGPVSGTVLQGRRSPHHPALPLAQLGTGLSHALPVLTQLALLPPVAAGQRAPLLSVEEPEAHLHPAAQAQMADQCIAAVQAGRCALLVETHSETFILRLQRRVAEGTLEPSAVALWWVDEEAGQTKVRALEIDAHGAIPGWPEGWFDAALREAQAIARAGRARR
ncbi:MAG: AAA family ATPase [Deltaproteobacteria bacterium]|jgi:hypothetical protein|nr:AAA family ATPase [Deltaproteobacteria bacterium]